MSHFVLRLVGWEGARVHFASVSLAWPMVHAHCHPLSGLANGPSMDGGMAWAMAFRARSVLRSLVLRAGARAGSYALTLLRSYALTLLRLRTPSIAVECWAPALRRVRLRVFWLSSSAQTLLILHISTSICIRAPWASDLRTSATDPRCHTHPASCILHPAYAASCTTPLRLLNR